MTIHTVHQALDLQWLNRNSSGQRWQSHNGKSFLFLQQCVSSSHFSLLRAQSLQIRSSLKVSPCNFQIASEAVCPAEIHPRQVGGKRRKVSPPSARRRRARAAAAPRHNYAIWTRWGLSPPAGSSGNRAGKVAGAREPPTALLHSLGRGKCRSASPKPSITPIRPPPPPPP